MKQIIVFLFTIGVITVQATETVENLETVDFNQILLERSFELKQASVPALKYLHDQKLANESKILSDYLAEMDDLVSQMRTDAFRERPVYAMETRLLANERAVIYEVRSALIKRSRELIEKAKKAEAEEKAKNATGSASRIAEQRLILEDLKSKLSQEEDEVRYIPLVRMVGEHQDKLEELLK